jgi:hypothetical protein
MNICFTRRELAEELSTGLTNMHFELVCDAYYGQFINRDIVNKLYKDVKSDILEASKTIYATSGVHAIALDLMATKINRLIDRRLVKQAGDIASLEFAVNVAKAAILYIRDNQDEQL